jgi:hypothetical protein
MTQPTVFISYSHHDEVEKEKLLSHLGVLRHAGLIDLWSDDRIGAGADWAAEMGQAIGQARVAILLITANYLTTEFILSQQIPQLLERRRQEGLVVFPVIARACAWDRVEWLRQMQVRPQNRIPVWGDGGSHVDEDLAEIAREVADIIEQAKQGQSRLFICYKRASKTDQQLADALQQFLTARGHQVFVDRSTDSVDLPLLLIDQEIQNSNVFIVLLSSAAVDGEMVQAEVRRAYKYQKLQGRPQILPVRVAYQGLIPYAIDAYLNPNQYLYWAGPNNTERIGQAILAAIAGKLPQQEPIRVQRVREKSIIFEDGSILTDEDSLHPPLPACDPRFLEELEAPGGTVKLRDKFYIERDADLHLKRQVAQRGSITTIRASRQKGKSSLLVRGTFHARQRGAEVIHLDLQRLDDEELENPDHLLRYMARLIVRKLRLNSAEVDKFWAANTGSQEKLTSLLEDYVLPVSNNPIVLAIDEADSLLLTDYHDDFFGMLRAWHNSGAYDDQWEKLNLILAISTEPYLLISAAQQSPFNAGLKLYLDDFTQTQVRDLNWRHGSPVADEDFEELMRLLNGHPYLTRKALYALVTEKLTWTDFVRAAAEDDGPFSDHLRRQLWLLRDEPALKSTLQQVIQHNQGDDEGSLFRLQRAGLVQKEGDAYFCRCDLYRLYFAQRL